MIRGISLIVTETRIANMLEGIFFTINKIEERSDDKDKKDCLLNR